MSERIDRLAKEFAEREVPLGPPLSREDPLLNVMEFVAAADAAMRDRMIKAFRAGAAAGASEPKEKTR